MMIARSDKLKENIVLIGYMACGKTSVAKRLGEILQRKTIEMDDIISERSKMSIKDIFKIYGEDYFRDMESLVLKEALSEKGNIISCGGGAVIRQENVLMMKERGFVVLLSAKPRTVFERASKNNERPLLKGKKIEDIEEMMCLRRPLYIKSADIEIETDYKTIDEIAAAIINEAKKNKIL